MFFIFNTSSCTDIIFVMNNLVIWEDWPEKKNRVSGKCPGNNSNTQFKKLADILVPHRRDLGGGWVQVCFKTKKSLKMYDA